jgi:Fe-S-cluster containining protein
VSTEYGSLVDKVDAFTHATFERRRADMACRAGCDGCCQVWLSVSTVEADAIRGALAALAPEARARVMERGVREHRREAEGESSPRCAMLESDGRCAVYDQRPLVCRTQGHALRYPQGFIPEGAVRTRMPAGDVTHCPLNFTRAAPNGEDVLDAERVDLLLALVNHRFAVEHGQDPATRHAISDAAASKL